MLEENIEKLAEDLKLPPFSGKDKESCYHLPLTNNLTVMIKSLHKGIAIFAKVAPLSLKKKEEAFLYFMKGNLLGQGTGIQALGLDKDEKFLTLSCIIPYDINYKQFKEKVEDFANYLDYWRLETEKLQQKENESIL